MLRSYFIVAWRNLLRNRTFSIINIAGLAIGMAIVFHIYRFVVAEKSYDKFHTDAERIYRVPAGYIDNGALVRYSAANHPALGRMLKQDFSEVEHFTRLGKTEIASPTLAMSYTNSKGDLTVFNETSVYYTDESFFSVFTFPLSEGDPQTSLKKPNSVVLSQSMKKKYFGDETAIGKTMRLNLNDYTVTGIMKELPENSHLKFDALASMSSVEADWGYTGWGWPVFYTYVKLAPGTDKNQFEKKLPAFVEKYVGKQQNEREKYAIDLQPISEIHLKSDLAVEESVNGSEKTIRFISLLGFFILAIAWINYINLSTARSIERAKEVGLRKVSGASRRQLITQFFFDACLVNIIALLFAVVLITASMPVFDALTGRNISSILLSSGSVLSFSFWFWVVFTVVIGILVVGFYPALLLSSFNPALILKGKFTKSKSGIALRKGLVGFQYAISIFLIAGTVAISRQLDFMHTQDLGYTREQVIVMRGPSMFDSTIVNQVAAFKHEAGIIPSVQTVSACSGVPGHVLPFPNSMRRADQPVEESSGYYPVGVDDQFFPTFEMPLVAGRNFLPNRRFHFSNLPEMTMMRFYQPASTRTSGANEMVINEKLCKRLGFASPEAALHQHVLFRAWTEFDAEIVGVVKNYHQVSLKDNYSAIAYFYPAFDQWAFFSARIQGDNIPETIERLKKAYTSAFPGTAFEYFFLNDYFNHQYKDDEQFREIFTVLTILAIVISCMGLLGLAIFSVSQRLKEIGIRKVLGASVSSILFLFSKDSIKLLAVSYLVTLPLVWMAVQSWLSGFAFHIGMEWIIFFIPPVCLVVVSMTTVIVIAMKTALLSPAISLRSE